MLKSKDITDFIETKVADLRPDQPIPADLHLYFKSNKHVLLWKPVGTMFSAEILKSLVERGIASVWIHKTEWETFHQYLRPRPPAEPEPYRRRVLSQELIYGGKAGPKGMIDILRDSDKTDREKSGLIAKLARTLLGELAAPGNLAEQKKANYAVSRVVGNFLKEAEGSTGELATEILDIIRQNNSEFSHSMHVATTSVLLAMAFGKIDEELLLEIGVAALFHDVGITQVPFQLAQIPWDSLTPDQMTEYLKHSATSVELIATFAPDISERAMTLVAHHHDDYTDPSGISPISDVSQLISLADVIDSLCSGTQDGQERTFSEALTRLESGRVTGFNKGIVRGIIRWIRENVPEKKIEYLAG